MSNADDEGSGESSSENGTNDESKTNDKNNLEETPTTHPENFKSVRGKPGKEHKKTGEVWAKDPMHKDHYEVYKDKKSYEKGKRSRDRLG